MKALYFCAIFAALGVILVVNVAFAQGKAMPGSELAVRWPELLGETVTLRVTPQRALSPARYVVKVDGVKAVMLAGPGKIWTGTRTVCTRVTGPESIPEHGATTVVGLMLTGCP